MKLLKLLSLWVGPLPRWYNRFVDQMRGYNTVDWECIVPPGRTADEQTAWVNRFATDRLGVRCNKMIGDNALCDFRPTYGELFPEKYQGYPWWGWCDLDVRFGDLDELLPRLLTDDWDVLNFKANYLSGCLAVLRNTPEIRGLYRKGPYREILVAPDYYVWDESGYPSKGNIRFLDLIEEAGLRVNQLSDLYSCRGAAGGDIVESRGKKLIVPKEVLLYHFMDDCWPEGV